MRAIRTVKASKLALNAENEDSVAYLELHVLCLFEVLIIIVIVQVI